MGSNIATARLQTYTASGWAPAGAGAGAASLPVALSGATLGAASSGTLTSAVAVNTTTTTTTAQVTAAVASAGNLTFHVAVGAFVGTLVFEGSLDGGLNWGPMVCIREDGTGADSSVALATATNFIRQYTVALAGYSHFKVRCSAFTSGAAAIYMVPGPFLIEPNPTLAAGTAQVGSVALSTPAAAALGMLGNINPYGTQRVTVEPTTVLMDAFDGTTIDVQRWTAAGTQPPTQSNGQMTFAPTVGASVANNASLVSVPTFISPGVSFLTFSNTVTLEAAQTNAVNVHRFWGKGQVTSFAYATPLTDAVGFEVDGATGALQCVVYIGGTKYVVNSSTVANITSSLNGQVAGGTPAGTALPSGAVASAYGVALAWRGGQHRYALMVRSDVVYWFIEGTDVPVAVLAYATPNVQGLPIRVHSITNNAGTSLANTFTVGALAVNDNSAQNQTISDPTYQWRRAAVSPTGQLRAGPYSTGVGTVSAPITTASSPIMSANTGRAGLTLYNDPASASTVYIACAATATLTSYVVQLAPGAYYETPYGYAGVVTGICASGTATVRANEFS